MTASSSAVTDSGDHPTPSAASVTAARDPLHSTVPGITNHIIQTISMTASSSAVTDSDHTTPSAAPVTAARGPLHITVPGINYFIIKL